jgi:predicted amidohydrolase YtcJ
MALADLVITNSDIVTMAEARPRAEAVAIADGRFVAVGTPDEIRRFIGRATRVLDLDGKTVVPGFNDAHMHPLALPMDSIYLGPSAVGSIDELVATLRERSRETPPEEWIFGWGYEATKLGRHPDRRDLDRVSELHPILLFHSSGHIATTSSYALRDAGIDRATPDPDGGAFDRDEDGEPSGVCRERPAIRQLFTEKNPRPRPTLLGARRSLVERFQIFHENGITSISDAWVTPASFVAYVIAAATGAKMRVDLMFGDDHLRVARLVRWLDSMGILDWLGRGRLRLGPVKVFHGNSLSGHTCWLYEPYADRPDYFGVPPARTQDELNAHLYEIHASGFQIAVHSNGDREIDMVLEAIERALARDPRPDHRHRIEHASIVNPRILGRVRGLGVALALHSYIYEHGDKMEAYGARRFPWMHANRSALELGIHVAGNSDFPVSAAHPLTRIQSLVTRTSSEGRTYGPEQRLSPEQAIEVFTLGGAYASHDEHRKGSIEAGKLADLVVLSADPTAVPPDRLRDIRVEMTLIGGEVVHPESE